MIIKEGLLRQDNPFLPRGSSNLSPDLVVWQDLQRAFAKFPTEESLRRAAALQSVTLDFINARVALFFGGSLAVGQSIDRSDIDIFGVATADDLTDFAYRDSIIDYLKTRIQPLLGTEVDFSYKANCRIFKVNNLTESLQNLNLNITGPFLFPPAGIDFSRFYTLYHTCLVVGNCTTDIIGKIDTLLTEDPTLGWALGSAFILSVYSNAFWESFYRYNLRLLKHPVFSALPEHERLEFMEYLQERERQFMFYLKSPDLAMTHDSIQSPFFCPRLGNLKSILK